MRKRAGNDDCQEEDNLVADPAPSEMIFDRETGEHSASSIRKY